MNSATPVYRIVQYPDSDSPSGRVFFVDKQVKKRFLGLFPYKSWETTKGIISGNSLFYYHFTDATQAVSEYKKGTRKHA
jgi:hypothetical protein